MSAELRQKQSSLIKLNYTIGILFCQILQGDREIFFAMTLPVKLDLKHIFLSRFMDSLYVFTNSMAKPLLARVDS